MAKQIIYLKEGSDAALLLMSHLQAFHQDFSTQVPWNRDASSAMRLTGQMLAQKAVQFEVWKLRMTSMEQRMQNIINLVRINNFHNCIYDLLALVLQCSHSA